MTAIERNADNPALGILFMLGFCALAPLADSMAKLLGERMDVGQLLLIRFGAQVILLGPFVVLVGRFFWPRGRVLGLVCVRAALHIVGVGMFFLALQYLPLADAVAIAFVMPFIMLILGHLVLGETVGRRRILACGVGFAGTLMVVQPSFSDVGWPALLPLGVAVVFALFMLTTRAIAKDVDPVNLQAVSGLIALGMLLPAFALFTPLSAPGFRLSPPAGFDWLFVLLLGGLGTLGHLLMTWSLRFAPSATLAPMQYLEIPFAALIGWLIFRDFPDGLALAGIVVTIGAGLYILVRERSVNQSEPPVRHQAPHAGE